jgi:hypothetical protein
MATLTKKYNTFILSRLLKTIGDSQLLSQIFIADNGDILSTLTEDNIGDEHLEYLKEFYVEVILKNVHYQMLYKSVNDSGDRVITTELEVPEEVTPEPIISEVKINQVKNKSDRYINTKRRVSKKEITKLATERGHYLPNELFLLKLNALTNITERLKNFGKNELGSDSDYREYIAVIELLERKVKKINGDVKRNRRKKN